MSSLSPTLKESPLNFAQTWKQFLKTNRLLTLSLIPYSILFIATIVLSIVDTRLVTGAPVWFKPMKFAISITLYTATLIWMLTYVNGHRRLVNIIAIGTTAGFFVELFVIFVQAARGLRSHYNVATPLDSVMFTFMGTFVIVIWAMNILAAILLMRQKLDNKPFAWALRLGLIVTAVGAGLGFFMTSPTSDQMAAMQAGETVTIIGAHSVGVVDGGPGLPFTGWSTEGGDMRIPHFVGLHAMQIVPLIGILLNRRSNQLSKRKRTNLVWISGLGYLGVVILLTWQAQRGQPLIAPDTLTIAAFASLVAIVSLAGTAVLVRKR